MRSTHAMIAAPLLFATILSAQTPIPQPTSPPTIIHATYPTTGPLTGQIKTLLADPAVARAHWGIALTTLDGTPLFGLDEAKLFRPASNNKIFTTATAFAVLGPEMSYKTKVLGDFDIASGTVTGDLTLVGGGDAGFGTDDLPYIPPSHRIKNATKPPPLADLSDMVIALLATGVKHITGDIVGDDTLFPYEPYAESWAADDQVWDYGAPVSALSIADNQLKLTVTPLPLSPLTVPPPPTSDSPIKPSVELEQNGVPYYTLQSEVRTVPAHTHAAGIQIERQPGSRILRVFGEIAADAHPDIESVAIADPAEYAAMALRMMLQQAGIEVTGAARAQHHSVHDSRDFLPALRSPEFAPAGVPGACLDPPASPKGTVLASHWSRSLGQDVVLTNKISQNLHAEIMLHLLGLRPQCGNGSILTGAKLVRAYMLHAGVDGDDFTFYDGSGLSDHDLITPRATATFLAFAARQPGFADWKASLPEAGVDGSLETRFPSPPLKGHIFAKTGTLGESRALSGYLDAASGHTLIFSIMVDNHTPGTSADRTTMDKIVAAIAAAY
jgi:D-alanyl-D-alanine carboxypeptidase/D-alanyl-D-alanine-endopeptidase (penicillin-binding protein 4)